MTSSFLSPGPIAKEHELAILHLRRDAAIPVILSTTVRNAEHEGYAEGMVTNTRFGSFPHSTIVSVPWGSQIRASQVDTGSRGRRDRPNAKKRKADALEHKARRFRFHPAKLAAARLGSNRLIIQGLAREGGKSGGLIS